MGLFTNYNALTEFPIKHVIHDANRVFELDKEYVENGKNEGWLRCNGWYQVNGTFYFTYSLT